MEEAKCPCPVFSHYLILHLIISSVLLFVAFIKVLMVPPFQTEDFILIGYVTASCILIAVMAEVFKYCLNYILKRCGVSEETRCRTDLLIGLGGITLCAVVPKVLVIFFNEMDMNTLIYLIYTLHFSISILSFTFLSNPKIHHFNYNQMNKCQGYTIFGLFLCYVTVFLVLLSVGVTEKPNPERVIATYSSFGIVGLVSILEFFTVCVLPIKLRSDEEVLRMKEKKPEGLEPEEPVEDDDSESFNDAFMRFYSLATILLLIFGVFLTSYTGKIGLAVLTGAVRLAVFRVLNWWSTSLGSERKLELWSRKLKIGFSGIAICGFALRIGIYFVGWNFEIIVPMFLISLVTSCSFYYLFVHGYRKVCNLNYDKHCSPIISMVIVQLLLWFLAIRIALIYDPGYQRTMLIHAQIGLFFMSLGSSVDLLVVVMEGVYLRDVQEVRENQAADVEQGNDVIKKRATIRIFCPMCKKSYSETTNNPRILRECGDTICEKCADFQLKERNYVKCPVCTIPTVVRGPASTLMKNFAIFDLMEKVK
ncbi:unnamed protein product [Caenorhabditis brenneri]